MTDGKESFLFAYEPEHDPTPPVLTDAQRALHYENQWPPYQDAFRTQLRKYNAQMTILARKLMQSFALGLALDETFFDEGITAPTANIKIIHYPPTPEDAVDETGIGPHTDVGRLPLVY
jgi:isopenicillin N synthase-like dioxygenase